MFELTYCSIGKPELTATDLSNILKTSKEFNQKNNITGCLLYHNGEFIQILEGDKKTVIDLYNKIKEDTRHFSVTLLSTEDNSRRLFNNWSMAYHQLEKTDFKNMGKTIFIKNFVAISNLIDKPTPTIQLFWYMARQMVE